MGKRRAAGNEELWKELGFASYRDWVLDCERVRREKKMAGRTQQPKQQPVAPALELPPRAQLGVAEPVAPAVSIPAAPMRTASKKAARRATREARFRAQRKRQEEYADEFYIEADIFDAYADAEEEIAEEEKGLQLTPADAEYEGSDEQWRQLSGEQQFDLAVEALNRR